MDDQIDEMKFLFTWHLVELQDIIFGPDLAARHVALSSVLENTLHEVLCSSKSRLEKIVMTQRATQDWTALYCYLQFREMEMAAELAEREKVRKAQHDQFQKASVTTCNYQQLSNQKNTKCA